MVIAVEITCKELGSVLSQVPGREGKVHLNFIYLFFSSVLVYGHGRVRPHE